MYTVTIKKLATGEERDIVCEEEWNDSEEFDWSENHHSCDCSRAERFAKAKGEEDPDIPCGAGLYVIPRITLPDGQIVYSEALTAGNGLRARAVAEAADAIDAMTKALEHARRNLIVALRVNVNLGDDFNPEEHVTIKEIDAALAKARG